MMRFCRRRPSPGLVALLAVAMQVAAFLVLAHVHPHVHPHVHSHSPDATRSWVKGAVAVECRAVVERPGCAPAIPHESREDCQLCWSFVAAGAATVPPDAGQLLATLQHQPSPLSQLHALIVRTVAHFEARGPPVA